MKVEQAMGSEKPDIQKIMAEIRARVKTELSSAPAERPALLSTAADLQAGPRKASELLQSEELRYLNLNYSYSQKLDPASIQSHRGGFLGKVVTKLKRKVLAVLRDSLLKEYLAGEREFQANLVRLLNTTVRHIGERDAAIFWELVRKIDVDVTRAMERIEEIADEHNATLRTVERGVLDSLYTGLKELQQRHTELQGSVQGQDAKLTTLDSVAHGLEAIVARLSKPPVIVKGDASTSTSAPPDPSYLMLENRFRGGEGEIAARLSIYPQLFQGASAPILEIGAGRGELQILLRNAGVQSYGVDLDQAMVAHGTERGVDIRYANGLDHLRSLPDRSLGGVIAVQVVEHLTQSQLQDLFALCALKVQPRGKVIFETINPRSLVALSSNYFRDPTHVWPLHPDTLSYAMELAGIEIAEVRMLSPVPSEAQLRELPTHEFMTPRWVEVVGLWNHNLRQLNQLLYGHQDYCVIGVVRG